MATKIQLKTGTGSAVPSSLTQGEVGINIDNGLIYYGSGSGNNVKQLESFTHITASGDISASGTITAATLDAAAVSDTLAAAIVAEIDNDEIPIAKLAEDAVTITAGTNLSDGGSVTLGGSITLNVDDAFLKNDADDTTTGTITSAGLIVTKATDGGNTVMQIINSNSDVGTDKGAGIEFQHGSAQVLSGNQKAGKILATKASSYNYNTANIDSNLEFYTANNDTDTLQLKIDNTGLATFTSDVSSSNVTATGTGSFGRGDFDDVILADEFIKLNVNNKFIQGKETGGTTRNILGINDSDIVHVANANLKTDLKGTNITLSAPITASNDISASGTIFSETEEILLFSSFKATSMTSDPHRFIPSQNGMNYYLMLDTNVTDISGTFVSSTAQANMHNGFMVPYKFLVTGIECQGRSSAGSNSNPVAFELQLHTGTPPDGTNTNTSYAHVASLSASSGNIGLGGSGTKHRNSFTYTQGGESFIVSQSQMLTPSLRRIDGDTGIGSTNGWISFTIKGHKIK